MKKMLIVCLMLGLTVGVLSGCSKTEQPVQELAGVTVQQPLVDRIAQVTDEAQKATDEAQIKAEEATKVAQEKAAETVKAAEEQLKQDTAAAAEGLKTDTGDIMDNLKSDIADQTGEATEAVTKPAEVVTEEVIADGAKEDLVTKVDGVVAATEQI